VLGIGPAGLGAFPQAAQQGGVWGWGCLRRARPWPGGGARRQGNVRVRPSGGHGRECGCKVWGHGGVGVG